jgi:hypothetical protein
MKLTEHEIRRAARNPFCSSFAIITGPDEYPLATSH